MDLTGGIKTLAGYHVEYSMLSGYYPLKHNVWTWYYYDTKNSCFKWIKPLKPLFKLLDRTFLRSPIRAFISYSTMFFRYISLNNSNSQKGGIITSSLYLFFILIQIEPFFLRIVCKVPCTFSSPYWKLTIKPPANCQALSL